MKEPNWLTVELVLDIHERQLRQFGGPQGFATRAHRIAVRAGEKPWAYEDGDLASLAAAYAFGLTRDHPLWTATSEQPSSRS